jgi:CheY-like chemotaxis protein
MIEPTASHPDRRALDVAPCGHGPQMPKIVVVDDNDDAAWAVAQTLKAELECMVHVHTDSAEAVSAICDSRPDVVLQDVCMPGVDGWQVAALFKRLFSNGGRPWLVALTGLDVTQWHSALLQAGFDDVLAKPALPAALVAAVRQGMQQRNAV